MKTIKDILGKVKLDENGQIDESIVDELEDMIAEMVAQKVHEQAQTVANEAIEPITQETKAQLSEQYEELFEQYKDKITNQFSEFCDSVFDKELEIPENIQKWAYLGERYADLIEDIRARIAIDEGSVDDEVKGILKEAQNEIVSLRSQVNENLKNKIENNSEEVMNLRESIAELKVKAYVHENYAYLSKADRKQIINRLGSRAINEDIDDDIRLIQKQLKFESAESMGNDKPLAKEKTPVQSEVEKKCKCPSCGKVIDVANNVSCSMIKCPDCQDVKLEDCDGCSESNENRKQDLGLPKGQTINEAFVNKAAKMFAQLLD